MNASSMTTAQSSTISLSFSLTDAELKRRILLGALGWSVFCVLAVVLRGVQWDETYEHAQVLIGQVPYPAGHPLYQYVRGAYSLQTYISAALLWLGIGPEWICGLRNVLSLMSTVIPVFLLGSLVTGRTLGGHVAVALALRGIHLELDGSYPITVWPIIYSNGMVGTGMALLVLFLLLGGYRRTGYLLAGLMPCIHIGQVPPVFLFVAMDLLCIGRREGLRALRVPLLHFAVGIATCAALLIVPFMLHVTPPTTGAYAPGSTDAHAIWKSFTAFYDGHRQFPPRNGQLALAGMLLLSGLAASYTLRAARRDTSDVHPPEGILSPYALGLFAYTLGIAALVWGTQLVHYVQGAEIPYLLIGWMPYRLINHATLLLLLFATGLLARQQTGRILLFLGLAVAAAPIPLIETLLGGSLTTRYFTNGEGILFGLCGAALNALMPTSPGRALWKYIPVAVAVAITGIHRFGGYCFLLGVVAAYTADRIFRKPLRGTVPSVLMLAFIVATTQLWGQYAMREHLPQTSIDRAVIERLSGPDTTNALIVAQPDEFLLQARTGHPVFVESATASLMSYIPALAPVIQQMYVDVYGIRFDTPPPPPITWQHVWQIRSRTEWNMLAQKYGFRYVLAPHDITLDLTEVLSDTNWTLYEVTPGAGAPSN